MSMPYFFASLQAKNTAVYHNEPCRGDKAQLVSDTAEQENIEYALPNHRAAVICHRKPIAGTQAVRQVTTLRNDGDDPLLCDRLSSLFIGEIGRAESAVAPVWQKRFVLYTAPCAWQGEAQWTHAYVEDLGLYPTYNHNHMTSVRFASTGTWSTGVQYPLLILEDTYLHKTWYFEIETGCAWYMELNLCGCGDNAGIGVMLSGAHEPLDGWYYRLVPGESYTTVPALYGCVDGGFEEAVADLTRAKRASARVSFPGGVVPVCFNEYMNCLWAQPTLERELPLIPAAAKAGCEYFVIDAGWFGKGAWYESKGDWYAHNELFGEGGLQGLINEIRRAGMQPGIWLEMESVSPNSLLAKAHPDWLCTRHGCAVDGADNAFMDFRKQEVRDCLRGVIDTLYGMGIRFIKNDYNHSLGIGIDGEDGKSLAQNLREENDAFYAFIDEMIATHPGLLIENCGSGAMRCDNATLSHFALQSTGDQEFYDRVPSIIQGLSACLPSERAGIWSLPYSLLFNEMNKLTDPDVQKRLIQNAADGVETACNMVTAMNGLIYQSGCIHLADGKNAALIADAIALYKKYRGILATSVPVYPLGLMRMRDDGWTTLGHLDTEKKTLLLSVWRLRCDEPQKTIDLSKCLPCDAHVADVYPQLPGFTCTYENGVLSVSFPPAAKIAGTYVVLQW